MMFKNNFIKEFLSDNDLEKISDKIKEIEKKTSGELRICIKRKRGYREKEFTPREIALNEFFNLKMNETTDKTGILFLIITDEKKFEIIADEGINNKIPENNWDEYSENIKNKFTEKKYLEGILELLINMGNILIKEFPVKAGDKNELSNEVIVQP